MIARHIAFTLTLACLTVVAPDASADVRPAKAFGDHMVLQQNQPVRVWGWADKGESVTVELAGKTATAVAGDDGSWRIELPAMPADKQAHTMTIKGKNEVVLKDVLLGEVWVCSGQSNMEWSVQSSMNAKEEIEAASHPMIRLYNVPDHEHRSEPETDSNGQWQVCSPRTVGVFSAVGYYFGRALQKELDVPIGLVGTNWGGTRIEPWTPPVGFEQVEGLEDYVTSVRRMDPTTDEGKQLRAEYIASVEQWLDRAKAKHAEGQDIGQAPPLKVEPQGGATRIYNGMVAGLTPLSVRGAIWYQGESNAGDGLKYDLLQEALVKGWRSTFENPDLSFYWVQLANFQGPQNDPAGGGWGPVREGQRRALRIPNTGMAVIIDIGQSNDIHPRNKQDVGARLARWALAKNYGKDLVYSGPFYKSHEVAGDKIVVTFDHVGGGLITARKEGLDPAAPIDQPLAEFAVQDGSGKWHWASAKINPDNTVTVWADGVGDPKHVRYAYQSNPVKANLYNKAGLPASPFTTVD